MLQILLLVCATTTPRAACDTHTALDVVDAGHAASPTQCGLLGQVLVAPTAIAPEPGRTDLVIRCIRADTLATKAP
jgi:hypothetical protein